MLAHFTRKMLFHRQYLHIEATVMEKSSIFLPESLKFGIILKGKWSCFRNFTAHNMRVFTNCKIL
jgi:hypothetical protein